MAAPKLPEDQSPCTGGGGNSPAAQFPDRSRLEETLVKSSMWKKQTLRDIEFNRALAANESKDPDTQTARLFFRLSAQLDERNDEIDRLRRTVSKLENEKTRLGSVHRRELDMQRAELVKLQAAYDQFEKESDSLLSDLSHQNDKLLDECRRQNNRSLLKL